MTSNDWAVRHGQAVVNPTPVEQPIVDLITAASAYIGQQEATFGKPWRDYVLGEGVAQILEGLRELLNGEIGRLDAGTCDMLICDMARRIGWDLDTSDWAE